MSRPRHLSVPNSQMGIYRINEEQREYDRDPEEYERREQAELEQRQLEKQQEYEARQEWEAQQHNEEEVENEL